MWELVGSLQVLQARYGRQVFDPWRQQVAHNLRQTELAQRVRGQLFPVAPHAAYFPDLLTPAEGALGVEEGIETVLRTPDWRLGAEFGMLTQTRANSWLDDLRAGRATAVAALGTTLRDYHRSAVEPYWDLLRVRVDHDLIARRQALREGGVHALLETFRPMMRWQPPVLEIPEHPSGRDIHLDGHGLLLIPSYFCWLHPITVFDPTLPQVVVYPVDHDVEWLQTMSEVPDCAALARLLGDTRAAVLRATQSARTTGDLARLLGVSAPAISHHTAVLRDNGLIDSRRVANKVLHTLTPLGATLLHAPAKTTTRGGSDLPGDARSLLDFRP
jgi:DNA-binding transcriptional ArsR family regulator